MACSCPVIEKLRRGGLVLLLCAGAPGCVETRVIPKGKPFMSGLPGTGGGGGFHLPPQDAAGAQPDAAPKETRTVNPDGTVTLHSPTVRDLMRHILETLAADEKDLFTRQLLSTKTRGEFIERGYDPGEAFIELQRRRDDLRRLFSAMPVGEFTPGVLMQPVGRNVFRLRAEGDPTMPWTYMDVVYEKREYRLRWFGR